MATKIKKNIEKGKDSVWFSDGEWYVRLPLLACLCGAWGGFLSQRTFLSLTERTEFTELFAHGFEPTERLRHTEFTERFSFRWV